MNDQSIAFCAIEASQTGFVLLSNQVNNSEKIKKPNIQPRDFGASRDFPSILSDFEIKSIILGNRYLLEITPPVTEMAIIAKTIAIVPLEKSRRNSSPAIHSFNISAGNPESSDTVSSLSCMVLPTKTHR